MSPMLIALVVFVGVSATVGAAALLLRGGASTKMEERLDMLANAGVASGSKDSILKQTGVLAQPLDVQKGLFEQFMDRFGSVGRLLEQADVSISFSKLAAISAALAVAGAGTGTVLRLHGAAIPAVALFAGSLPMLWILFKRKRRLNHLGAQLPEAMEMLSRALRAGQSLPFGMSMVASEVGGPLGAEFGRVFDEQNLGIPLDESLNGMAERVPNLDIRFFATAVILQRQTGGDLAEILDKIGSLIRERFKIWGQIQALTGEGRISGIVLLALPVALFLLVYQLNPKYVSVLFTDPSGKKMMAGAIVLQILGALWIRKIVNIKV